MSATKRSLTRREFLKAAGTAAFVTSAGGAIAACTNIPTAPAPAPVEEEAAAPAPAAETVPVVLAIQAFAHDALKPVIAPWEEKTGIKVMLESGPTTGQEMMTKYAPAFQSSTSPVDVLSVDDVSGPAFARAGWVLPLDDIIPQETWADFPESFLPPPDQDPFHSYDGKRYRVPHEFAVGYFWHRKDWFDEKGITAPTTWDEFVQIGKEFTTDPVGHHRRMKKPGLTFVYLAYLTAQARRGHLASTRVRPRGSSTAMT
jgi:multiple sugar transport system substrate-binding protein